MIGFVLASIFWLAFFAAPYVNLYLGSPFEPWAWDKLEKYAEKHNSFWWFAPFDIEDFKRHLKEDLEK